MYTTVLFIETHLFYKTNFVIVRKYFVVFPTMPKLSFDIQARSWYARAGTITLNGVSLPTPVFMPVGTKWTIKGVLYDMLTDEKYLWWLPPINLILNNTYHTYLRPWPEIVQQAWGLHTFQNRKKLILTDSGGYQAFSLWSGKRTKSWKSLVKITDEWVRFASIHDGSRHMFTPEGTVDIQVKLGSDIMMMLDVCSPPGISKRTFARDMQRTHDRARRQYDYHQSIYDDVRGCLFPIVQGWLYEDLRQESIDVLSQYAPDGIAVWWVSVGEPREEIKRITAFSWPRLPEVLPRYLMGIGNPEGIRRAVQHGFDMFDCVVPTRLGRHGVYFTDRGPQKISRSACRDDHSPLDESFPGYVAQTYTKAYLHHVWREKEMLGAILLSHHNIMYLHKLVTDLRKEIVGE